MTECADYTRVQSPQGNVRAEQGKEHSVPNPPPQASHLSSQTGVITWCVSKTL